MRPDARPAEAPDPARQERLVLGRAARLLAAADDFEQTLAGTIAACLPALGDFGFFDVVVAPGEVQRTSAAHEAPDVQEILTPTRWAHQPPRADGLNLCALSSGEPALHPDTGEAFYQAIAAGEDHLRVLRQLAFTSMLTVPMHYRGELVGALTLFMGRSGRRHTDEDLALAGELAMLAAPVVANARLAEQHRLAEAALRASEERLRIATDAGGVGIWDWDIAHNRVEWSDRTYEMHGMAPGSETGGLAGFRSRVHPDDLPWVEQALRDALAGTRDYAAEFRTVLPDGQVRWIATRGHILRDAAGRPMRVVGANIDTTERVALLAAERGARAESERAGRRLELLARAGDLLARSLAIEDVLQAIATTIVPDVADWCRIDLLDEEGRLQRRVAHHSDPQRATRALDMARSMQAAPETVGSMAWCLKTGQSYYGRFDVPPATEDAVLHAYTQAFEMREHFLTPLVARGRTLGTLGVVQAESGRTLGPQDRALVQELAARAALALDNARLYGEAERARRQAEFASRSKDEFLAMLGHELRNPLAPIATALELMARREPEAHVAERRIVERQVKHLSRLIDDLLDVSRITQGKIELQRAVLDIKSVVGHALEQTQPVFERRTRGVELRLPDAPVAILGDAVRLTQVLCNLLINAAKFTPPDGRVALSVSLAGDWVDVAVEDSGRGMPAELLPRVFELFVQGRQSADRQQGGLGLGLAIVRMLVEMHGGKVAAFSAGEGRGSRFVVRLPRHLGAPAVPGAPASAPSEGAGASQRLLIVDDNQDAAETLAELLRVMGYEVRCAHHAEAALALVGEYVPQLALLDIGLPGMDGYQLAERLRADPRLEGTRLVALTGYGGEGDRARALAAHFDEHLVKPVAMDKLEATLQRLLPAAQ